MIPVFAFSQTDSTRRKLIVFFSPGCHRCIQIKKEVMPGIEKEFKDKITIEYRDINDIENYKLLLSMKEKYNPQLKIVVPVFYFEGSLLDAKGDVRNNLRQLILGFLKRPTSKYEGLAIIDLVTHMRSFRPLVIIGAGLEDGINPCAFTVIVFFISFLALQGYKKKELVLIGSSFIFAVFLTYLLIGLGLFGFLYRLKGFWLVAKTINIGIGMFSIVLGLFALYDFFKFKRTGQTEGLILQLPAAVKNQIHKVIGLHYRVTKNGSPEGQVLKKRIFRLVMSALITGFLVSILEAVCTGQVYLPTIVFVLKTTPPKLQAVLYLLLYNLMFIVPLFIILLFALLGVTSTQFSQLFKKHLSSVKILMAVLFFALGIFLIWGPQ